MKQRIFKCSWIRPELAGIHLVDKCLILFMTILLIQSACTLLGFPGNTAQANEIDGLQILIAAAVGLFCLFTLILLRNAGGWGEGIEASPSATATVAQFRDLVSGCVGFLIGSPTNRQR